MNYAETAFILLFVALHNALTQLQPGFRLGIIGGGQLARMLALQAHNMGIEPWIFSENSHDPAAQVCRQWTQGSASEVQQLTAFLASVDVATFESEFIDHQLAQKASKQSQISFYPEPSLMGLLQDRLSQKNTLIHNKIPTSPFYAVTDLADLHGACEQLQGDKIVLKKRLFGYDGYGTFVIKKNLPEKEKSKILSSSPHGFIAEAFVPFKKELAIILARDQFGSILEYPLVISQQTLGKCDWVMGPVKHTKAQSFVNKCKAFLKSINYVGVMGFEIFDTGKELLLNEIAPRVHNSAHYSLDACQIDQFSAHVRAVCGLKLPAKIQLLKPAFAMANLVGSSEKQPTWSNLVEAQLHWYGKIENRPGRKMGHINSLANSAKQALQTALKERKKFSL